MKKVKNLSFLFFILLISSCVKNVDFDQADDFSAEPEYIASLVYFKIPAVNFLDTNNVELNTPLDEITEIEIFQESYIQDNLVQLKIDYEIDNPYDRVFNIIIEFMDDNNNTTYALSPINITANSSLSNSETIIIADNPQILNSTKFKTTLVLDNSSGTAISPNDFNEFIFKSAGTFSFKL